MSLSVPLAIFRYLNSANTFRRNAHNWALRGLVAAAGICFPVMACPATLQAATGEQVLFPSQTTSISAWPAYRDRNFSGEDKLFLAGTKDGRRLIFVSWNLSDIPTTSKIAEVTIVARVASISGNVPEGLVSVTPILESWEASQVTWQNKPTIDSKIELAKMTISKELAAGTELRFVDAALTQCVQQWILNPNANFGVAIQTRFRGVIGFDKNEALQLVIKIKH